MTLTVAGANSSIIKRAIRLAAAVAVVFGITFVDSKILDVNSATAILSYLLAILALATRWGLLESTLASVVAVLCVNFFFLPPVRTFTIADPQNWVALIAFLGTAVTVSHLSARAKQRTQEALLRQHEMERLYELGRSFMLTDPRHSLADQIAGLIAARFELEGAAYFDREENKVTRVGGLSLADDQMRAVSGEGTVFQDWENRLIAVPVSLGGKRLGSLALAGGTISDSAVHAIANLTAIALERHRAQQVVVRADIALQNEEFKSTLLDAVAHSFKTPLTSIKAAVTMLISDSAGHDSELLAVINEESDRLSDIVTEAIRTSRIEAGNLAVYRRPFPVVELIERSTGRLRNLLEARLFRVDIASDLPLVSVDPELVVIVLQQLLSNAANYSSPGKPIVVRAMRSADGQVLISVSDEGPGISEEEQPLIFERFYRGKDVRDKTAGTGMGLAIAREIVRGHGSEITLESRQGSGSVFSFALPIVEEPTNG